LGIGLAASGHSAAAASSAGAAKGGAQAQAELQALKGSGVAGTVTFTRTGEHVFVQGSVTGLEPGKHGMHIHEGTSCEKPGSHFNPAGSPHGSPDQPHDLRHVGDLGNLVAMAKGGKAQYARVDPLLRLDGNEAIVGRVLIIHQGEDDYLSQPSGNSGDPIACGVIRSGAG